MTVVVDVSNIAGLLWGTVVHRPYVYAFFACFLVFAVHQLGPGRTLAFTVAGWLVAFACEYSSTRNGFPFGPYRYFDETRSRELWISNVPFWDSLSFVFLAYFSFALAAALLSPAAERARGEWSGLAHPAAPVLGGALMTLLDVVIDPVALQGEKWFLGRVYDYPHHGFWFGVTAANFAGWLFVGVVAQWILQRLARGRARRLHPAFAWGVFGVYAGVFAFNVAMTAWIRDFPLLLASGAIAGVTLAAAGAKLRGGAPGAIVVCAATRTEAAACRSGLARAGVDGVEVLRTGVGPERAARALRARLDAGPAVTLVVSSGFAGALSPGVGVGAFVTAASVHRLADGRALPVAAALVPAPAAAPVAIVSAPCVVRHAPAGLGPAAADMESAALAAVAASAGVPFSVFRLVSDTPASPLPPIAAALAGSRPRDRAAAAWLALTRPAQTAAFVGESLGWVRRLRSGWEEHGARLVAAVPDAGGRRESAEGGR